MRELAAYFPSFAFLPNLTFKRLQHQQLQIGDVSLPNLVLVSKLNQMPECWSMSTQKFRNQVGCDSLNPERRQTFEAERVVIGKSFKWCGCRLFVCFLICFCHEGGLWGQAGGVLVAASCPGLSAELPLCPASVYPWTCPWAQCTSASKPAGCPGARTQWWTVKQSGGRVIMPLCLAAC